MSIDGRQAPRPPLGRVTTLALLVPCEFCWAAPATPCTDAGQHYTRFLCIYRRGILDTPGSRAWQSQDICYVSDGSEELHPCDRGQRRSGTRQEGRACRWPSG